MTPTPVTATSTTADSSGPARTRETRLREQCRQFESVMLRTVLRQMRKTVGEAGGPFGASEGERMTRDMYDERLADVLAQRGSLGVSSTLLQRLLPRVLGSTSSAAGEAHGTAPAPAPTGDGGPTFVMEG